MDVQLRYEPGGLVLIGNPPAAPAGAGIVAAPCAEIHIDPTAPDDPPYAVIHDAAEAAYSISETFGRPVAEAAMRPQDGVAQAPYQPGDAAPAVRTLGLLTWLENASPDLLPVGILDIEYGNAVLELADAVADHLIEEGEARLVRRAELLAELSRRLRDGDSTDAPAGLAELVAAALPRLRAVLPINSPHYDNVEHEDEFSHALRAFGSPGSLDWTRLITLPEFGPRAREGATHLGTRGAPDGAKEEPNASVDWYQVPRGLLDTAEDTVRWSLSADLAAVTVAVRAAPGAPRSSRLAFRMYCEGRPLPLACGRLRLSGDGTEFVGSAPVIGTPTGHLQLDVHDAVDTRPPRLGLSGESARGTRWAARGITALRLAGGSARAWEAAQGGLLEAAQLFKTVADEHRRTSQKELGRRRQARCMALVRAVMLLRGGYEQAAAQTGRRWDPPTAPVTAADTKVPDLSLPGWSPLVTEQALVAAAVWREL